MQICQWKTQSRDKKRIHKKPKKADNLNRRGWNKNDKLENLQKKAKINPNTIWEARRRAKGCKGLEYTTYTEEGEQIQDPAKTKEHIANYFEDLYQAREGKEEYETWTKRITRHVQKALREPPYTNDDNEEKISTKEMEMAIKKLKRNKSVGPDKIPNEIFIEANKETKQLLKTKIENIHATEDIPQSWEEGEIILYKGKAKKENAPMKEASPYTSQQRWESIQNNYQWKSKKTGHNHQGTGRWQTRMLHSWPPYNPQTNDPGNTRKKAYCIHNLPRCTKSIWQGVARRNTIRLKQQWS